MSHHFGVNKMTDNIQNNTPIAPVKKKNYLNNKDMLVQLALSREQGKMTNELAKMFMMLTERYAKKGCYIGYSYNDDMRAHALMSLVTAWSKFNPEKSNNPFAFFTECIKNSFNQILNSEKKQRVTRDVILIKHGLDPSYSFTSEDYENTMGGGSTSSSDEVVVPDEAPVVEETPVVSNRWKAKEKTPEVEEEEVEEEENIKTSTSDFSDEYDIWAEMDKDQQ